MKKMIIIVTVPVVLETWFKGQPNFLSKYYDIEIITSNSENIKDIEKYENVPIKIVDFNRKINLFKDLKVLIQLTWYLIKNRPYFVYTLTPKAGLLGMMSAFMVGVPNRVHSVVGLPHLEARGKRRKILMLTEKLTYFFATNLYCNSLNLVTEIKKLTKKQVSIIGNGSVNGVDVEFFKDVYSKEEKTNLRIINQIKEDDFVITFIGRIVKDKGINELIAAFVELKQKYRSLKLLMIGDFEDELNPVLDETKKIIKSEESIIYKEFQEDVRPFLAMTDLFILPSYREGLPNVLIEAGSYGIPLLATNINGCNEIIMHNKNGLLVDKKDKISLYNGIEKFIVDIEYYSYIKSNVRKSIIDRYSQKYFYNELSQEFRKIIEAKR